MYCKFILLVYSLSYFSIAVQRHHDQGNLQVKEFIWAYSFIGWIHDPHGRAWLQAGNHGTKRAESLHPDSSAQGANGNSEGL